MSHTEKSKIGHYEFLAEPFHCDLTNRLFVSHLGNHLLNAADFHSDSRGFGMKDLNPQHRTWVLSRLAIELEEMPPMYSRFFVDTWVENALRFFTNRNFHIYDATTGQTYGYGRSTWAMIDTNSRQPVNIFSINDGAIGLYVEREKANPMPPLSRVKMSPDVPVSASVAVTYADIDINGHVNSLRYVERVMDLWPPEWHKAHPLRRIDIAYVAEAHHGDNLLFAVEPIGEHTFNVRISRQSTAADVPTEVCRCQIAFR